MGLNIIDCALLTEIANRCSESQKQMAKYSEHDEVRKIDNLIEKKEYFLDSESDAECITFTQIRKRNTFHVTFIGSNSKEDWIADLDFIPIKLNMQASLTEECLQNHDHSGFKLHRGIHYQFMKLYPHLKEKVNEFFCCSNNYCEHEIVISGHSLGGGLAIMAAIYLYHYMIELRRPHVQIKIITIGAPRVLNKALANWYNTHLAKNTWRIVNHYDSIPNLPVEEHLFEYTHVNATIVYIKNGALLSRTPNERSLIDRIRSLRAGFTTHGIDAYIKNLNKFGILKDTEIC
jgi:hypothetical protein